MRFKKLITLIVGVACSATLLSGCGFAKSFEEELNVVFMAEGDHIGDGTVTQFKNIKTPTIGDEYLPDAERVGETHEAFNQSLLNALDGEKVISPTIIKNGHAFLDELEKFQTLPPAKNKEIKKLIGDMRKDTREVLRVS